MNNMKEATTDAMKETTGKVVNEKEKATTENIETIKKTMENTDGIDPKLLRFLAIWSGFCIVLYALGYFVGSWIVYLYCAAPLIAWCTFGFTFIRKKKRLATYNFIERRLLTVWTFVAFVTAIYVVSLKSELSNFVPFLLSLLSIAFSGICMKMVERTNNTSVSTYLVFTFYPLLNLINGDYDLTLTGKIILPLFLLIVLTDGLVSRDNVS
jgi:putative membrane protein